MRINGRQQLYCGECDSIAESVLLALGDRVGLERWGEARVVRWALPWGAGRGW